MRVTIALFAAILITLSISAPSFATGHRVQRLIVQQDVDPYCNANAAFGAQVHFQRGPVFVPAPAAAPLYGSQSTIILQSQTRRFGSTVIRSRTRFR